MGWRCSLFFFGCPPDLPLFFADPLDFTIWAIHVRSSAYCGELTKAMAMQLLATPYPIGFWHIEPCAENLGKDEVLFSAQLPGTVKPEDFKAVCGIVAQRADNREATWRDQDVQ